MKLTPEDWAKRIARWGAEYFPGNTPANTFWQFFRGIARDSHVRETLKYHAPAIITLMAKMGGRRAGESSKARAKERRERAKRAQQGELNL